MPGSEWSEAEKAVLRDGVAQHGHRWSVIVKALPGRAARAAKDQWARTQQVLPTNIMASAAAAVPAGEALSTSVLPVHHRPAPAHSGSVHSGRAWNVVVRRSIAAGVVTNRSPSEKQQLLVENWALHNARGHGLLLCNLRRAEDKLRTYFRSCGVTAGGLTEGVHCCAISVHVRDSLGMVIYPGEPGATLTRSCAAYNWVGGEEAGAGRFVTPREVAAFMGIDFASGPCCVARRYYSEIQLCGTLAESVHSSVASYAAAVGRAEFHGDALTVGSLYSGAFDELGSGVLRHFPGARRAFVTENDSTKMEILARTFGGHLVLPGVEYVNSSHRVDVLVASPPCLIYSKANRTASIEDQDRAAREQVGQVRRILTVVTPKVFIMEQTAGLKSHCPHAYELFSHLWDGLPYRIYHSVVDAHRDCSGSHHRERLIWVAVKVDD